MDLEEILAELRGERDLLGQAIVTIENLARESKRGRGRPPGSITKSTQKRAVRTGAEDRQAT